MGWSLNALKDGDCRTSLDNLLHCLAALTASKFLCMSCLRSCFQPCPLSFVLLVEHCDKPVFMVVLL